MSREHIFLCDERGPLHEERGDLDAYRRRFAHATPARTLAALLQDADVFVGLSAGGIVTGDMIRAVSARPIVFALANPTPEIMPDEVRWTWPSRYTSCNGVPK